MDMKLEVVVTPHSSQSQILTATVGWYRRSRRDCPGVWMRM